MPPAPPASTSPTSAGHLLQLFRTGEVSSRRELQDVTGLARTTVTFRVDALLQAGYLVEDGPIRDAGRGRPAVRLRVNDHSRTILVADLGATHGRLAISTAAGQVLAEEVIQSAIDRGASRVLDRVSRRFDRLLASSGRSADSVAGVAVGVPGPVAADGRIARATSMPGWGHHPVGEDMHRRYGVPVVVENDANLMGLGEQALVHPEAHMLVFVKVGTGIGAAIVVDGRVVHGRNAAEGDLGHVGLPGSSRVCTCGRSGCLAASASGRALVASLRERGRDVRSSRDVVDLARSDDADAAEVVTEAGRALGSVLSTVVGLLNPDVVVVGGDLAQAPQLVPSVRTALLAASQPFWTSSLDIAASSLQDRAGIAGAALMIQDQIFGPDAVDAVLDRRSTPRVAGGGPAAGRHDTPQQQASSPSSVGSS
jgi:predicted NBD/HSP70 family sugar kinase